MCELPPTTDIDETRVRCIPLLILLTALVLSGAATAAPIVSVDADPDAAGTQPSASVLLGSTFEVDIFVEDVASLNGYQLTLAYDDAVLTALDVESGGFLPTPVFEFESLGMVSVFFAEASVLPASGQGVLASIRFEATALGTSVLDLVESNDPTTTLILAAPLGNPICGNPGDTPCDVFDGAVTVVDAVDPPTTVIPEPSSALLFLCGAGIVANATRRRA